jgi:hypothetical protein
VADNQHQPSGQQLLQATATAGLLLQAYYCRPTTEGLLLKAYYCRPTTAGLLLQAYYCRPTTAGLLQATATAGQPGQHAVLRSATGDITSSWHSTCMAIAYCSAVDSACS